MEGKDELSDLAQTFNEMAGAIQQGINDLKKAQQERTDLIANISHDLRSPLTSIRGAPGDFSVKRREPLGRRKKAVFRNYLKKRLLVPETCGGSI